MTQLKKIQSSSKEELKRTIDQAFEEKGVTERDGFEFVPNEFPYEEIAMTGAALINGKEMHFGVKMAVSPLRKDIPIFGFSGGRFLLMEPGSNPYLADHILFLSVDELKEKLSEEIQKHF